MTPEERAERLVTIVNENESSSSSYYTYIDGARAGGWHSIDSAEAEATHFRAAIAAAIREAVAEAVTPEGLAGELQTRNQDIARANELLGLIIERGLYASGAVVEAVSEFSSLFGGVVADRRLLLSLLRDLAGDGAISHRNAGWNAAVSEVAAEAARLRADGERESAMSHHFGAGSRQLNTAARLESLAKSLRKE